MKKYVVIKKVSLVVNEGSLVELDDRQYEIARQYLKPLEVSNDTSKVDDKPKKKAKK